MKSSKKQTHQMPESQEMNLKDESLRYKKINFNPQSGVTEILTLFQWTVLPLTRLVLRHFYFPIKKFKRYTTWV